MVAKIMVGEPFRYFSDSKTFYLIETRNKIDTSKVERASKLIRLLHIVIDNKHLQ